MGFTDEDANFEPGRNPKRSDWLWASALLASGALAFGGCVYAMQRAGDAFDGFLDDFLDFDFGDGELRIGWDEVDETPVSTVPPQPDETCAALARVAWFTESSGKVWRESLADPDRGLFDDRVARELRATLPELRAALWDAIAVSPPPVADPLALALGHVVVGIGQLEAGRAPAAVALVALEGGAEIDEASDALGSGCGDLDLIGPFDTYFVVGQTTTTTTVAPS